MHTESKRWQIRIEVWQIIASGNRNHTSTVYGETPDILRPAVKAYLLYEKLVRFSNMGDHLIGRMTYFFSDGIISFDEFQEEPLERGWWCQLEDPIVGLLQETAKRPPEKLGSYEEAIDHYVAHALIPERGPEYQSKAIIDSELRLPLLEKIVREGEEYTINDLIVRGWHIIALEYKGELSMSGELVTRRAIFVMGHPDAQAAAFTLNSVYYKRP
jgi:hypothetical protein